LPDNFIGEIRYELIDSTSYTDNEINTFAKIAIKRYSSLLNVNAIITDGTSIWDYTINEIGNNYFWEVIKYATIYTIFSNYGNRLITEGIGISIGLGSERVDTKTLLSTVYKEQKEIKRILNQKILAYNMQRVGGYEVDLYARDTL